MGSIKDTYNFSTTANEMSTRHNKNQKQEIRKIVEDLDFKMRELDAKEASTPMPPLEDGFVARFMWHYKMGRIKRGSIKRSSAAHTPAP